MATGVTVQLKGALFTDPGRVLKAGGDDIEIASAEFGADLIRKELKDSIVNPTGNYVAAIAAVPRGDMAVITDSGVIYGPWIEGVASRNTRSRFKGYSTFRRSLQQIDAAIPLRTEPEQRKLARNLERET